MIASQNLKTIPERELQRACQYWMNLEVNTQITLQQYGLGSSSITTEHLYDMREAIKPFEQELARRSRLVLK